MGGAVDLLATDGLSIIGTVGFFVPAAILVALVAGAVVRDRRLSAREAAAEVHRAGMAREEIPEGESLPRPPAD
jgi:site-specific recombinase